MAGDTFDLSKPNRRIHAGVILMNSVTEILDVAPFHIMGTLGSGIRNAPDAVYPPKIKDQALDIECHWVNETGHIAQMTSGMRIQPTDTFATCPPLDIILIGASKMDYVPNEAEIAFLRKSFHHCSATLAVCGGYRPLLLAGLLDNRTATAPISLLGQLRQTSPEVTWVKKRWHQDGKLWTTGQLINGLDAMRAFVESTWGSRQEMVDTILKNGAWPARDVDYLDM